MTAARDIMNSGVSCMGEHETLSAAARHMREHDIGRHLPKHAVVRFVKAIGSPAAIAG
ncbi:hypothetical protein [Mycobacterium sp.]|uniref:hypothetical protein n=1 Tax=Mycobacterium sp. TaxID=1785 RepID=UPI0025E3D685|nr:hypothetical protein [Mycobacterium sp.]